MARKTHLALWGGVRRVPYFLAGTLPDQFTFIGVQGAALSATNVESNEITITGLGEPVSFTVSGDASAEYQKNGGAWTAAGGGTCDAGDTFKLRVDASASYSTGVTATLDVNGISDTFIVTTLKAPAVAASRAPITRLHARR